MRRCGTMHMVELSHSQQLVHRSKYAHRYRRNTDILPDRDYRVLMGK